MAFTIEEHGFKIPSDIDGTHDITPKKSSYSLKMNCIICGRLCDINNYFCVECNLKSEEITEDEPQDDVEIEFLLFEGVFIQNIKESKLTILS